MRKKKPEEPLLLVMKHGETHIVKEKASEKGKYKCNSYEVGLFGFFTQKNLNIISRSMFSCSYECG